jgi:hypothetical protein
MEGGDDADPDVKFPPPSVGVHRVPAVGRRRVPDRSRRVGAARHIDAGRGRGSGGDTAACGSRAGHSGTRRRERKAKLLVRHHRALLTASSWEALMHTLCTFLHSSFYTSFEQVACHRTDLPLPAPKQKGEKKEDATGRRALASAFGGTALVLCGPLMQMGRMRQNEETGKGPLKCRSSRRHLPPR